ncbi:hypothetical protein QN277_015649 [Acacia crassicarpa]|uniref:Glycosyltransferase n=2 Tax=Acacia crassicarpa TaxID=499986 RepID=A0AAE1JUM3_9FABA|nr:hypothetical protein QN277_015649 [Acacia crassicarpa]
MGHLVPAVEFAKLLINRHDRLTITVLIITPPSSNPTFNAYTHSLTSSLSFPQRLHFILLPPHPDPTNSHSLHPSIVLDSRIENQKPNVRDAVSKLNSVPDSPRLAGFVVDVFCTAMIDVATEFGVPSMVLLTYSAAFLGFKLHTHTLQEQENVDTTAFDSEGLHTEFAIPSFENPVPVSAFPGLSMEKQWTYFFLNQTSRMKKANAIIVNTFEELEPYAVRSFSKSDIAVYPVGPILSVGENKTDPLGSEVMKWLDDQPDSSVLFLCFGSKAYFEDEKQVREIALALEASGVHFVWSLRKPAPKGLMNSPSDYSDLRQVLPEGFLERTCEMGRVIGWAPQAEILAHKAVGGFVSHCGWNSILESIYNGVPIATWPLIAEQHLNAFMLVREFKLGVEISLDYGREVGRLVSAERIEKGIREVMEKESEVRKKVKYTSQLSRRALMEGGSSYSHLGRLFRDLLNLE